MAPWRKYLSGIDAQALRLGALLFAAVFLATVMIASFVQPMPEWPRKKDQQEANASEATDQEIASKEPIAEEPSTTPVQEVAKDNTKETDGTLAAASARVVAPDMTPAWAHVDKPLERVKDYRDEIDPRRKTAKGYKSSVVLSAGIFKVRVGKRFVKVALSNVDAVPFRKRCRRDNGKVWFCGGTARAHIARLLRQRTLFCNLDLPDKISLRDTYPAQCWLGNTNVADIIIREGWGTPVDKDNKRQRELAEEAKRLNKGIWRNS